MKNGQKFWELVEKSVIFSGLVATLVTGSVCWMWVKELTVPREASIALFVVLIFFFGHKTLAAVSVGLKKSA